jgi:hypothetical protein
MEEKNRFGQIILVDSPNDVLKAEDNLVEIDGGSLESWWSLFDEFFEKLCKSQPPIKSQPDSLYGIWNLKKYTNNPEWLGESTRNGRVFLYISSAEKMLPNPDDKHLKCEFFDTMVNIANDRVFLLLDRSFRNSMMEYLDIHRHRRERLESENTIRHRQILFVEKLEDVKLVGDEFIVTVEGKQCATPDAFYDEISMKLNFWKGSGRNLDALDELINELDYSDLVSDRIIDYSSYSYLSFIYFKDVREILPDKNYDRSAFFDILDTMCNERTFLIIDRIDMEFVRGEVKRYRKTREKEKKMWRLRERKEMLVTNKEKKTEAKFRCPCCGYRTFGKETGELCPVCSWYEYGIVKTSNPYEVVWSNGVSLNEAKENFGKYSVIDLKFKKYVREPREDEL